MTAEVLRIKDVALVDEGEPPAFNTWNQGCHRKIDFGQWMAVRIKAGKLREEEE